MTYGRSDGDFCSTHERTISKEKETTLKQSSKRAALLQKQKEKNQIPRKKPNQVSEKQRTLNETYSQIATKFKLNHPKCEARVNEYCTGKTDDIHHSRGHGKYFLDETTFIAVCRSCHIWIGNNHKEAEAKGLIFSRLATIKQTI